MFEYTVLLIILFLAHTLADFVFQNTYHQGKFLEKGWFMPLADHSYQHSLSTFAGFVIWTIFFSTLTWSLVGIILLLSAVNFVVHMIVDRIKAHPKVFSKYPYPSKGYFVLLGFDQYAHIVTTLILAAIFFGVFL